MPSLFRFVAGALALTASIGALGACDGGTVIFDAVDPKQCASGNGCPMVTCTCNDGSFMVDSTCELGACKDAGAVCDDRCSPYMGAKAHVSTEDDNVAIPGCEVLYDRMLINRCKEGTELLASECESTDIQCSPVAQSFWQCVIGEGILSCKRGALRVLGCETETADQCTVAPSSSPK
jgi:hypothetical protein